RGAATRTAGRPGDHPLLRSLAAALDAVDVGSGRHFNWWDSRRSRSQAHCGSLLVIDAGVAARRFAGFRAHHGGPRQASASDRALAHTHAWTSGRQGVCPCLIFAALQKELDPLGKGADIKIVVHRTISSAPEPEPSPWPRHKHARLFSILM